MKWHLARAAAIVAAIVVLVLNFQDWVTLTFPQGDYHSFAGEEWSAGPHHGVIGPITLGVAAVALLSNVLVSIGAATGMGSKNSLINATVTLIAGLYVVGLTVWPIYSGKGFATTARVTLQNAVNRAPPLEVVYAGINGGVVYSVMAAGVVMFCVAIFTFSAS